MIVYEVNLDVDVAVLADYRQWLAAHIRTILSLPGLLGARLYECREPAPSAQRQSLCVRYRFVDAAALDRYLREDAPRLREDGERRFGSRFSASRRVLQPLPLD